MKSKEVINYNDSYNLLQDIKEFERIYLQAKEDMKGFLGDRKLKSKGKSTKNNMIFLMNVLLPVMVKKIEKQIQDYASDVSDVI